ncbi:MAG: hypothetical protein M0Z93_09670 [Actinomycetota bacterium]|jgi:hypothetical protein|nr:hypothetical protein [Actinomycetota bacterium]
MDRRDDVAAAVWVAAVVGAMVAIAAYDPLSWHAHDAGYPSVPFLVAVAAVVLVAGAGVLAVLQRIRQVHRRSLLVAGVAGVVAGILGNMGGILTIHALGGGNSAADIWSYPVIWYIGNPADASITLGAVLVLVWAAAWVTRRVNERGATGVMVVVAVLPLLVAGTYSVARGAEITGWQPPPVEQLARVVAHRAGLSESTDARACASQLSQADHRPRSVVLTAAVCPAVLRYVATRPAGREVLVRSAPSGTFGPVRRAGSHLGPSRSRSVSGGKYRAGAASRHPARSAQAAARSPGVTVTVGPGGSVVAALLPAPVPVPAVAKEPVLPRALTKAQGHRLSCVRRALDDLVRTDPRFAVLAVTALCAAP